MPAKCCSDDYDGKVDRKAQIKSGKADRIAQIESLEKDLRQKREEQENVKERITKLA